VDAEAATETAYEALSIGYPKTVVLNLFYTLYPFMKQDYQIYPWWWPFIETRNQQTITN